MSITKRHSRKVLKKILNESVILVLNLEEGKDFSYEDIDEAKDAYDYRMFRTSSRHFR